VLWAGATYAQLPANPWVVQEAQPNDGYMGDDVGNGTNGGDVITAPVYQSNSSGGEILPVDPWARARDRSGVRTWRGSGQHGKLNYIGEATTYTTAYGQEMIAPEVNRHNMIVMLEHLRKMGYKIPDSYDQNIKNMPKTYTQYLHQSISDVNAASDPFSRSFVNMLQSVENATGLDFNNILFTSMDILGTD
jgi:hypothetical protein